jgi:hypothetical protein
MYTIINRLVVVTGIACSRGGGAGGAGRARLTSKVSQGSTDV